MIVCDVSASKTWVFAILSSTSSACPTRERACGHLHPRDDGMRAAGQMREYLRAQGFHDFGAGHDGGSAVGSRRGIVRHDVLGPDAEHDRAGRHTGRAAPETTRGA